MRRIIYSDTALATTTGYRLWLWRRYGSVRPPPKPSAPWRNAVLQSRREWLDAVAQVNRLALPRHPTAEKHWDSLAMLDCILEHAPRDARILDAGGALYSVMLPWLFLYGYHHLNAVDLSFTEPVRRGPIRYQHGDITDLHFSDETFDVVICQSVLEHGVSVRHSLDEASRVLKPGGLLLVSVDYFDRPVDVTRIRSIDPEYFVFDADGIRTLIAVAEDARLELTGDLELGCDQPAVKRSAYEIGYTFLLMAFRKTVG